MNDYPWEQLSLIPPPGLRLTFTVYAEGTAETVQVGCATHEWPSMNLVGLEVTHFPATTSGEQDLMRFLHRYILGIRDRTSPFG